MKSMAKAILFTGFIAATTVAVGDKLSSALGETDSNEQAASTEPAVPAPEGAAQDVAQVQPAEWTYADRNAIARAPVDSAFPSSAGEIMLPSKWTYADMHAAEIAQGPVVDAFPKSAGEIMLASMSTYADQFPNQRNMLARAEPSPTLGE